METVNPKSVAEYVIRLENEGEISNECKYCIEVFYPRLFVGAHITDIFAPRHKPSARCRSGKNNHCTCDTCF